MSTVRDQQKRKPEEIIKVIKLTGSPGIMGGIGEILRNHGINTILENTVICVFRGNEFEKERIVRMLASVFDLKMFIFEIPRKPQGVKE